VEHRTPLHYTCLGQDADSAALAAMLIKADAQVDNQDVQFKPLLHLAIEGLDDIIDLLLSGRADVNLGNMESGMNNSPLMDAAKAGNQKLVGKLITARADISKQGKQRMSVLHLAARGGHAMVVQDLIEARSDLMQ